ncbi:MAG: hypothetical protein K8R64_02990 [Methanosarcinaceae archaeon]|nr:hypothetical protein [Methanosarcinaceae archaeon]
MEVAERIASTPILQCNSASHGTAGRKDYISTLHVGGAMRVDGLVV